MQNAGPVMNIDFHTQSDSGEWRAWASRAWPQVPRVGEFVILGDDETYVVISITWGEPIHALGPREGLRVVIRIKEGKP